MTSTLPPFTLGHYSGNRKTGQLAVLEHINGNTQRHTLPSTDGAEHIMFVGLTTHRQALIFDPVSKNLTTSDSFPENAFPAHLYSYEHCPRGWLMNDGDKATGNDTLNCGDQGSSTTVVSSTVAADARHLATVCIGRGHHQACFSHPSPSHPNTPQRAFISNLKDGSLSVVGNDASKDDDLQLIGTIDLCETDKDENQGIPNNAFPHGLVFSAYTGKVYNLNNGYGTVVQVNPDSLTIERRFSFPGHSNLMISPCGRYLIGRGADRKSNPEHVLAKLTVYDLEQEAVVCSHTLTDVYISKYFFNPEGSRLYLTTSASGSDAQKANLHTDALLVFDLTRLPELPLISELRLGAPAGTLAFIQCPDAPSLVCSSNSATGSVSIIAETNGTPQLAHSIQVNQGTPHSRIWTI